MGTDGSVDIIIPNQATDGIAESAALDTAVPTYEHNAMFTSMSCAANNPLSIINGSTFTVVCDWRSNDNENIISIKTNNAGELLNSIHSKLTPRPYTGVYAITDNLDTLITTAAVGTSALTTSYATIFDVVTDTSVLADRTLGGIVTGTFTISDNSGLGTSQTLNDLYLGTYTDTIHVKITQQ